MYLLPFHLCGHHYTRKDKRKKELHRRIFLEKQFLSYGPSGVSPFFVPHWISPTAASASLENNEKLSKYGSAYINKINFNE